MRDRDLQIAVGKTSSPHAFIHPCAAALVGGTGIRVKIKRRDSCACFILDPEEPHIGMPDWGFAVRLAYRLLLIPVIGAISYELLRLSGRYRNSIVMRIFTLPGLAFQRLTTREPSEDMIEVAVKAVEEVSKLSGS